MADQEIRYYVVLTAAASAEVRAAYLAGDAKGVRTFVVRHLGRRLRSIRFDVEDLPSGRIHAGEAVVASEPTPLKPAARKRAEGNGAASPELIVVLRVQGEAAVQHIHDAVERNGSVFVGGSPDLPFAAGDHWCPSEADNPIFGTRAGAERLIGIDYLREQNGTSGAGVNVVIVDQGLDAQALGAHYGGGWPVGTKLPGTTQPVPGEFGAFGAMNGRHGMMMARNILKTAPGATLFDLPVAPWKINDIPAFLSLADAAFRKMLADIKMWRAGRRPGPWVLVNPWGIFDTRSEIPTGSYTNNPHNPFNRLIADAVRNRIDVVFAAGNCGQFCPDWRCAPNVIGPGGSILGANSHRDVLSVGAVRADGIWLGYSAQGPGQSRMDPKKPDLCASSQFREDDDTFSVNTGTSAACAMAAGIVTAFRSRWDANRVRPQRLKKILNDTARKPAGPSWKNSTGQRFGNGVLDAKAAFGELARQFP